MNAADALVKHHRPLVQIADTHTEGGQDFKLFGFVVEGKQGASFDFQCPYKQLRQVIGHDAQVV